MTENITVTNSLTINHAYIIKCITIRNNI